MTEKEKRDLLTRLQKLNLTELVILSVLIVLELSLC